MSTFWPDGPWPFGLRSVPRIVTTQSPHCRFLHSLETLVTSASRGCAFCKLIQARIQRKGLDYVDREPAEAVTIKIRVGLQRTCTPCGLDCIYDCYNPTYCGGIFTEYFYVNLVQETSQSSLITWAFRLTLIAWSQEAPSRRA